MQNYCVDHWLQMSKFNFQSNSSKFVQVNCQSSIEVFEIRCFVFCVRQCETVHMGSCQELRDMA